MQQYVLRSRTWFIFFSELKLGTFKGLQDWLFLIANFFSGFTQAIAQE